jgi:hypothetical protein
MSPHDILFFQAMAALGAAALLGLALAAWRLLALAAAFAARWAQAMQAVQEGARPLLGALTALAETAGPDGQAVDEGPQATGWGVDSLGTLTCLPRNGRGLWAALTRSLAAWLH